MVVVVAVGRRSPQAIGPGTVFHIQAVGDGLVVVAGAAPVADHHAVKAPLALQYVEQQALVVAVEFAVVEVVGAHYRPGSAVLDGRTECRQVYFVEGAVVHHGVRGGAARLLVVDGKVLDAGGNSVLLHALHVRGHHCAGEERVLAHIFEIAPVKRGAADVHAGAQQYILLAVAGLLADSAAEEQRHFPVPGRCKAGKSGERSTGIIGPAGLVPLVPEHFGTDSVRAVGTPHLGDSEPGHAGRTEFRLGVGHRHLLLSAETRQGVLDTFFDGTRRVKIRGDVLTGGAAATDQKRCEKNRYTESSHI